MWKYKYVDIQNQELVITNLPCVDVIPQVLVELAQMRESKFCYFNQARWFDFLTYLLYKFGKNIKVEEKNQFYMYGSFWFDSFWIDCQDHIRPINVTIQDAVFLNLHDHLLNSVVGQTCASKLLRLYNFYYGMKRNVREVINSLFAYNNVATLYLFNRPLNKEDFVDLPKGWKNKLTQLDKLLFSNALVYFQDKTFKESFDVLNKLKFYTKKYGILFHQLIDEQKLDLDNPEDVKHKFYTYLNKNNRLLCEPLRVSFALLGNWQVVELNTTYSFVEESAIQNHCIGRSNNYINRVRNGEIRAFSFRKNNLRYTIVYCRKGNTWFVEQGKCVNNRSKESIFSGSDLKYLEVNIERLKKELEKQLRRTVEDDLF